MQKSLIGLALLVALPASATEIYSMDDFSLDFSGEAEAQYLQPQTKNSDTQINISTATLKVDFVSDIPEDTKVGGHFEFDGSGDTANISKLYVYAVVNQSSTISVGRQSTIFDDGGIGDDYAFGFTSSVDKLTTSGDQVVKYKYDGGETFYGGVAYMLNKNNVSSDYLVDGNIGARTGDFEYTLFAAQSETSDLTENNYQFEVRYTYGNMTYAGTYGYTKSEQAAANDTDINLFGLAATWDDGGRWSYAAGWANVDNSTKTDPVNDVYVNATFWVTDSVSAYAEIGLTDDDAEETGYVIGMDVNF